MNVTTTTTTTTTIAPTTATTTTTTTTATQIIWSNILIFKQWYHPMQCLTILALTLTLTCLSLIKSTLYPNFVISISETPVKFVIFFLFPQAHEMTDDASANLAFLPQWALRPCLSESCLSEPCLSEFCLTESSSVIRFRHAPIISARILLFVNRAKSMFTYNNNNITYNNTAVLSKNVNSF